jgi:hypothetical protein
MKTRYVRQAVVLLLGVLIGAAALGQDELTADEILDRMQDESDRLMGNGTIALLRMLNEYDDGTDYETVAAALQAPDKNLTYFLEPWDLEETMYLTVTEVNEQGEEESKIWYYAPYVYDKPKEIVSEEERKGGFAGSAMSMETMAEEDVRADYDIVLLGEETLTIDEQERIAYVIESTAKPNVEAEYPRTVMWVDAEVFTVLKMEGYNELGELTFTMDAVHLGTFEDTAVVDGFHVDNRRLKTTTTITISDRRRPEGGFPDDLFTSEGIMGFDPAEWGF